MPEALLYHNPRCSKSRQTLRLLEDQGVKVIVIDYLKSPPSIARLRQIVELLDVEARDLLRTKEKLFRSVFPTGQPTNSEALALMCKHPILLQRPIVIYRDKAAIGRPPENVIEIL